MTRKQSILFFVIALGIGLRLCEYLTNRSMWFDEATLALNVINRSFFQLVLPSFDYTAPIGFLLSTKLLVTTLGQNEYIFRAIPLVSGVLSFFVFYKILIRGTSHKAAFMALILFGISIQVTRYATEFKQYSTDILFALVLQLWGMSFLKKQLTFKDALWGGVLGAAVIWFSFPAIFVLVGIGTTLLCLYWSNKRWAEIKNLGISYVFWGSSFLVVYFLSLHTIQKNPVLAPYWINNFMPLPPHSLNDLKAMIALFWLLFYNPGFLFEQSFLGGGAFILGGYAIYKKDKALFFIFLTPLIVTAIASSFHQYPFSDRHMLFYVPFLYLFIAAGLAFLMDKSFVWKTAGLISLMMIVWSPMAMALEEFTRGTVIYSEEIKPTLKGMQKHFRKSDTIYVYYGAEQAFLYYAKTYGLDNSPHIKGLGSRGNFKNYAKDLSQLKNKPRVWVIFSHVHVDNGRSEEEYMTDFLDSVGKRLYAVKSRGASAYLYQFANK